MKFDEYNYTDKVVRYISLRFIRIFNNCKKKRKPKEVIDDFYEMYEDLLEIAIDAYIKIARHYGDDSMGREWVEEILNGYDPVTKYIFMQEVDRKRSRHTEAVIASEIPEKETDKALRLWSNMVRQYADNITDRAYEETLKKDGAKEVMWVTQRDGKVCSECSERDGKMYPINKIPSKPHIGCRCYVV